MVDIKSKIQLEDQVIFYLTPYYAPYESDNEQVLDGHVSGIYDNGVLIHYLYGYESMSDLVKYEHIIARYNEECEHIRFKGVSGKSEILNQDLANKFINE